MFIIKKIKQILKWIVVAFLASTILSVIIYRFVPVLLTPTMLIRCVQQVKEGRDVKMSHHWVPLERISVDLPTAVMAGEDTRFLDHHGFDFNLRGVPPLQEALLRQSPEVRLRDHQCR